MNEVLTNTHQFQTPFVPDAPLSQADGQEAFVPGPHTMDDPYAPGSAGDAFTAEAGLRLQSPSPLRRILLTVLVMLCMLSAMQCVRQQVHELRQDERICRDVAKGGTMNFDACMEQMTRMGD